jgi:SAM-dependent methyltransferase
VTTEDLKRALRRSRLGRLALSGRVGEPASESIADLIRAGYRLVLRREPDPSGFEHFRAQMEAGALSPEHFLERLLMSLEFRNRPRDLLLSLHASRCDWVRSLPRARRILDVGGASQDTPAGALVELGYPYPFERLTVVDLPDEQRHPLFRAGGTHHVVETPLGPVEYRYQSMTDLSGLPERGFDMVFMGQSIEHVTRDEGDAVLRGTYQLLEPGGALCLDTPNVEASSQQGVGLINPDHKVEYKHDELSAKLVAAGFTIADAKGLNWLGTAWDRRAFDAGEAARHQGIYHEPSACYVLAYVCRKAR